MKVNWTEFLKITKDFCIINYYITIFDGEYFLSKIFVESNTFSRMTFN